mmetsp:Transcript_4461/g.13189  ORF Transcript_4461/g.13189 Transcript_4461/m.13189 type:complete len:268 (-) Transcript_4461:271-1074(-)
MLIKSLLGHQDLPSSIDEVCQIGVPLVLTGEQAPSHASETHQALNGLVAEGWLGRAVNIEEQLHCAGLLHHGPPRGWNLNRPKILVTLVKGGAHEIKAEAFQGKTNGLLLDPVPVLVMHVWAELPQGGQGRLKDRKQTNVPKAHRTFSVLSERPSGQRLVHLCNKLVQHPQTEKVVIKRIHSKKLLAIVDNVPMLVVLEPTQLDCPREQLNQLRDHENLAVRSPAGQITEHIVFNVEQEGFVHALLGDYFQQARRSQQLSIRTRGVV